MKAGISYLKQALIAGLVLIPSAVANTQSWPEAYSSFQEHYDSGRFEAALQLLEGLETASYLDSASYYYNLGNTHYRLENYGLSSAYLAKAVSIQPNEEDIRYNLNLARVELSRSLDPKLKGDPDPAQNWASLIAEDLNVDFAAALAGLCSSIVLLFWTIRIVRGRSFRSLLTHWTTPIAALLIGSVALFGASRLWVAQYPGAVFVKDQVVRSGPGPHFLELIQMSPGVKIRVLNTARKDSSGREWRQIRYTPDLIGWVPASTLLLLTPSQTKPRV